MTKEKWNELGQGAFALCTLMLLVVCFTFPSPVGLPFLFVSAVSLLIGVFCFMNSAETLN